MSHLLSGSLTCPKCDYGDCPRIRRTKIEKFFGERAKHQCNRCRHTFFVTKKSKEGTYG